MESTNRAYYAVIPANVRYDQNLTDGAKLMYGEISALCNEKGYCWATNNYFADLYRVSEKTVSRRIQELVSAGHIVSSGSADGETRKIYLATPPQIGVDKNVQGGWTKMSRGGGQKCPGGVDKNVHHNNISNNKEEQQQQKQVAAAAVESSASPTVEAQTPLSKGEAAAAPNFAPLDPAAELEALKADPIALENFKRRCQYGSLEAAREYFPRAVDAFALHISAEQQVYNSARELRAHFFNWAAAYVRAKKAEGAKAAAAPNPIPTPTYYRKLT